MGKRGPSARGEYSDKSAVLSTRVSAELRARLEKAVRASGHTLSREVEHRLRRTFDEETKLAELFGSQRNFRLVQLIGLAMTLRDSDQPPKTDWLSDPSLFVQVIRTIHHLLWAVRPAGTEEQFSAEGWQAEATAEAAWIAILEADPALPLGVSPGHHRANVAKADLGEIVERVRYGHLVPPPPAELKQARRRRK